MRLGNKAVVSGARGYLGTRLCNRLLDDGWSLTVILRDRMYVPPIKYSKELDYIYYDGTTESLLKPMVKFGPDVVFHLASLVVPGHDTEQVGNLIRSNVEFPTQLIESSAQSGVKRFVNTGTSWQHYRRPDFDPVCLYAATKQAFECVLDYYADAFKMSVTTLKLFDVYGPSDPRPKVLNLLLNALSKGERLLMSPGNQCMELVHVDDVIEAYLGVAYNAEDHSFYWGHKKYGISAENPITLRGLVALLEALSGKRIDVTFGGRDYRPREVMIPWSGSPKPPGWRAKIDLPTGLSDVLSNCRAENA